MEYTICCFQEYNHMENVLLESSIRIYRKHVWMRIHDMLEEIGIDTKLANPYQDKKIIAKAKIKSDKLLDAIEYII